MENLAAAINDAADVALSNAMYRYTFGIVGNGEGGLEGRGIGTGIGVSWRGQFLILTAAHTMETTAYEQLYILLPHESLVTPSSSIRTDWTLPASIGNTRVQFNDPQVLLDSDRDLAAFVLPSQALEQARRHFYSLDDSQTTPQPVAQIGFLGYPKATRLPVGLNFVATPYSSCGLMVAVPDGSDPDSQIAISYPPTTSVDPHGVSGSGLWLPTSVTEGLWTPEVSLVGLVTHYDPQPQVLLGYRVEELVTFLKTNLV